MKYTELFVEVLLVALLIMLFPLMQSYVATATYPSVLVETGLKAVFLITYAGMIVGGIVFIGYGVFKGER